MADAEANESTVVYNPIKWTMVREYVDENGEEQTEIVVNKQTMETLMDTLDNMDKDIEANTRYALDGEYTITWEWAWEENNVYDTALGMYAAAKKYQAAETGVGQPNSQGFDIVDGADAQYTGTVLDMSFQIEIVIEQVQERVVVTP